MQDLDIEKTEMRLPTHDLWMTFIKNLHFIPQRLSPERFCEALSQCLRFYRPVSGKLVHLDGSWKIRLEDSDVPLEIDELETLHPPSPWVVQDSITSYLPSTSSNDALFRVRMTIGRNETLLGIVWHHTLGDATTLLRFMRSLSQVYQGQPLVDPIPNFSKYDFPAPNAEQISEYTAAMPHLANACPASEITKRYADWNNKMYPIRFILRRSQAEKLRNWVQDSCSVKLTVQDCITGCIVVILNICQEHKLTKITNAAGYRGIPALWADTALAGNPIYVIPTDEINPVNVTNIRHIAQQVRQSLISARQPDFIQEYMSVAGHYMSLAAKEDRQFFFGSDPHMMSVNSNLSLDWHSVHFGYPGSVRFHTTGVSKYYLRVFSANPTETELEDGIEFCFGVPREIKDGVLEKLEDINSGRFEF